jgi:glyoxylate reductase
VSLGNVYIIVNMTPLPSALVRSLISMYAQGLAVEVVDAYGKPKESILAQLERAHIVIGDYTFRMKIGKEELDRMKHVKLIAQPSTGYDHIDVEYAAKKGIPVSNIGGANASSVAEHTIMLALALLKRLTFAHSKTAEGRWIQQELMDSGLYELEGKCWAILGLGRIGKEVARRLQGWNVRLVYHDKVRAPAELESALSLSYVDFAGLFREADVLSIHLPLTQETKGIISEAELRSMKPSSIIVNTSRGEVMDEGALARALEQRWIFGAALDVFAEEPLPPDHAFIRLSRSGANILLTPHVAGATSEARQRIIRVTAENVARALRGEKPMNVVNM